MTEETFVQLFWAIAIPTIIVLAMAVAGGIHRLVEDPAIRYIRKMERARKAWAKMLEDARHGAR